MYIMSDIATMLKVHEDTLDTMAQVDIEEYVPVKMTTSHPIRDRDGTLWNVGTSYEEKKGYSYAIVKFEKSDPDWSGTMILEHGTVEATIPSRHRHSPAYYHSFAMTDDYVVFVEQPLFVDEDRNAYQGSPAAQNLKWKKTEMAIKRCSF